MTAELPLRISSKIRFDDPPTGRPVIGPCWTFTGRHNNRGYGDVTFGRGNHNRWLLHRYTYTLYIGEIPAGLQIDHLCRNRACCNPCHLDPVTNRVNALRGIRAQRTHCARGGHELSGHNLIIRRGGRRQCRACTYDSQRRSLGRRRATGLPDDHRLHGTLTGYQAYACRCVDCRAAGAAAWRKYHPRSGAVLTQDISA